ncbi:ATP-binding protein [Streptosporangium sp. V21-05]|uniref:ATP-binding protein n=1 Tax=Streptosporangium sp. V21-05 TaxID=3446115 RepID=UPI003F5349E5
MLWRRNLLRGDELADESQKIRMPEMPDDYLSRAIAIPPVPRGVRRARAWVRAVLDRWQLPQIVEPVELVASELVTNAVQHTHGEEPVSLLLAYAAGTLRLEVRDGDSASIPVVKTPSPMEMDGRGLLLVEGCTDRWGVRLTAQGKAVWCEFDIARRHRLHAVRGEGGTS